MDKQYQDCLQALQNRCACLYRSMGYDPNRPFWEMEFVSILTELTQLIALFGDQLSVKHLDLVDCNRRVGSLETRYSELLYQLKDRK